MKFSDVWIHVRVVPPPQVWAAYNPLLSVGLTQVYVCLLLSSERLSLWVVIPIALAPQHSSGGRLYWISRGIRFLRAYKLQDCSLKSLRARKGGRRMLQKELRKVNRSKEQCCHISKLLPFSKPCIRRTAAKTLISHENEHQPAGWGAERN